METLNKILLIGNLGKDPELKKANEKDVVNFSIATKESFKTAKTQWHKIVVWDKRAIACKKHLKKGSPVHIEGVLEYGSYEKDGIIFHTTQIRANNVIFL